MIKSGDLFDKLPFDFFQCGRFDSNISGEAKHQSIKKAVEKAQIIHQLCTEEQSLRFQQEVGSP